MSDSTLKESTTDHDAENQAGSGDAEVVVLNDSLLSYWPCVLGAAALVLGVIYIPWARSLEFVFATILTILLLAPKPVMAISAIVFLSTLCADMRAGENTKSQHQTLFNWLAAISTAVLLASAIAYGFFVHWTGITSAQHVFNEPSQPDSLVVHNLTDNQVGFIDSERKSNGWLDDKEVLYRYLGERVNRFNDDQTSNVLHVISALNHDDTSYWAAAYPQCTALTQAYLSAPRKTQERYQLFIGGHRVMPGAAGPTTPSCRFTEMNSMGLSLTTVEKDTQPNRDESQSDQRGRAKAELDAASDYYKTVTSPE